MDIALIHPSRGRPSEANNAVQEWYSNASGKNDIYYILSTDSDDKNTYSILTDLSWNKSHLINHNRSVVDAVNIAAKYADEKFNPDIYIVISDDFGCCKNWDLAILNSIEGREDWILKTNDGPNKEKPTQEWLITLPILHRTFYHRFEYIYNPLYEHMFADTEMTHISDLLGTTLKRMDLHFPHRHYITKSGIVKKDETSRRADATWNQGEAIYLRRVMENFGLKKEDIKSTLNCHNGHKKWLENKGIILQ